MRTLLTFNDFSEVAKWKDIEKRQPGGLPATTLPLIQSAITYSLDNARHNSSPERPAPGKSVFLIIPYDIQVPTDDYVKYVGAYVVPQMDGWIAKNVLAGYNLYITRYSTERPGGSLLVLEYRDNEAFRQTRGDRSESARGAEDKCGVGRGQPEQAEDPRRETDHNRGRIAA